jgi:hypothetical protein
LGASTHTLALCYSWGQVLKRFLTPFFLATAFTSYVSAAEPSLQAVTFKHPDGRAAPAEIYIDGEITPSLPRQLATALGANQIERATIYINSVGGDLQAGLELGEFIRKLGFNTAIGKRGSAHGKPVPGSCQSACLLVFAGGVYRFADSKSFFGIHRFFSRQSGPQDLALGQVLSAAITGYLMKMDVSPKLFERMVNAGAALQKLPVDEAIALNLVNNGSHPAVWEIVGRGGEVFLQGEQRTWNGTGRMLIACSRAGGLQITAQYDADLNTRKILSETKHVSLRLDSGFVGVEPKSLVRATAIEGDFLTTRFSVTTGTAGAIGSARSIGFAWLPLGSSVFYGFDIPTSQHRDLIFSFSTHCTKL